MAVLRGQDRNQAETQHDASLLRVFLLGGFRVERGDEGVAPTAWERPTARTLFKLLAVSPGHTLHRDQIVEILWPEAALGSALNSFHKALHWARRAVEPELRRGQASAYLHLAGEVLSLDKDAVWIDADHFEALVTGALGSEDVALYESALAAYTGVLLPEDRYADCAGARRTALASLHLRLRLELAAALERGGALRAAAEQLHQALQQEPTHEEIARRLMRLLVQTGRRHEALRLFSSLRETLQRELGVDPEPETLVLHAETLEGRFEQMSPPAPPQEKAVSPLPAAVRGLPETPFVGRERASELVADALARAAHGSGGLVLVSGELGVGKTRFVAEVARQVQSEGARVLWGASYAQEGQFPYGPFVEALEGYLRALPAVEREPLRASYPDLIALLPSLEAGEADRREEPAASRQPGGERARLFGAVTRLLEELAESHPLLLVLDDLQEAETESLQLLHHLARLAAERSWLLLGTVREEDVAPGSELQRLIADATRTGLARRVRLLRLGRSECDHLVEALVPEGRPSPALCERLYALSLGNPLFVQELVEDMQERGELALESGTWYRVRSAELGVPRQIRDLVRARVGRLEEGARRVLDLAAVVGMESHFADLRMAASHAWREPLPAAERQVLDALDTALELQLLEERELSYTFRHPLFQATIYESLARPRRAQLHGALGEAIERRQPDDVEALAYHYARSGHADKALIYLERAADRARAVHASETAEGHYRELILRLDRQGRSLDAARARRKLGAALAVLGRYEDALNALEQAAAAYGAAGERGSVGLVVASIGRVHFARGNARDGIERILPLLEPLERSGATAALAALHTALAPLFWLEGRYAGQLEAAERGAALARSARDEVSLAAAEVWRGTALLMLGQTEQALGVLEGAIPLAEKAGEWGPLTVALINVAAIYAYAGQLGRSIPYGERALELAERQGDPTQIAFITMHLGWETSIVGDWDRARLYLQRAKAVGDEAEPSAARAHVSFELGRLCLYQGDWEAASRYLERATALTAADQNAPAHGLAQEALAELDLMAGRAELARDRLQALLAGHHLSGAEVGSALALLAWAHFQLGDIRRAEELADAAEARLTADRVLVELPRALRVKAMVLARRGRWDEAEALLGRAVSAAHEMPFPYAEALALYDWGRLCIAKKRPAEAQEKLEAALALFRRLGAGKDVERTEQALLETSHRDRCGRREGIEARPRRNTPVG